MSAHEHINPNQLRMFMTARELYNHPSTDVSDTGHWYSLRSMHMTKRRENAADGLTQHVAKHGVHVPVTIAHTLEGPKTSHGHHRIVAAYDANPNSYVPVEHEDWGSNMFRSSGSYRPTSPVVPDWEDTIRFPSYP